MTGAYSSVITNATKKDKLGRYRAQYLANKKIILATQSICGICGQPVDKSLKYPHPMSPSVDHIIPLAKNGDPYALDNLQLAHRKCNREKSDKLPQDGTTTHRQQVDVNRDLPLSRDWSRD